MGLLFSTNQVMHLPEKSTLQLRYVMESKILTPGLIHLLKQKSSDEISPLMYWSGSGNEPSVSCSTQG